MGNEKDIWLSQPAFSISGTKRKGGWEMKMKKGQKLTKINRITLRIDSPLNYDAQQYNIKIESIKITE